MEIRQRGSHKAVSASGRSRNDGSVSRGSRHFADAAAQDCEGHRSHGRATFGSGLGAAEQRDRAVVAFPFVRQSCWDESSQASGGIVPTLKAGPRRSSRRSAARLRATGRGGRMQLRTTSLNWSLLSFDVGIWLHRQLILRADRDGAAGVGREPVRRARRYPHVDTRSAACGLPEYRPHLSHSRDHPGQRELYFTNGFARPIKLLLRVRRPELRSGLVC